MSAVATGHHSVINPQPRNELTAIREISQAASCAGRYDRGLDAIFSIVLSVPGIWRISIKASPELPEWLNLERTGKPPEGKSGSAVAPLEAGLHSWGQLRIYFELASAIAGNPLRFTRYTAQQVAALLDRGALEDCGEALRRQIFALSRRLKTRKAVARAIGLIAQRDGVSLEAALAHIVAIGRGHQRSLLLAAECIIFLEGDGGDLQSPTFRRLLPQKEPASPFQNSNSRGAQSRASFAPQDSPIPA